jgi:mono/diheme cytochrome c family protein
MSKFAKKIAAMLIGTAVIAGAGQATADEGTIALGGKLYDKWFKVVKAPTPKDTHMSWPASNTKKKGNATHRCKSCHGWDYMGKDGAYASGSYKTGISGLRGLAGGDAGKVVAALKDKTHGYAGKMDDGAMNALAMFVTQGQVDMDAYIDRAGKKAKGDAAKGKDYYGTLCVNCHGAEGKEPKDMPALGGLSNGNPWEVLHKILNGQPGEGMPGLRALPQNVSADVLAYLQTLPKK